MAITYPLSLPATPGIRSIALNSNNVVANSRSPFTGKSLVHNFGGQFWTASVNLPRMTREQVADWQGFLQNLRGKFGTFLLGDPIATTPRGSAPGAPVVDGANQTGNELAVRGLTASQTGVFLAGDFIQIGNRLYQNTTDADSDGSGETTLDIWPFLRESPADGATLLSTNPKGLFRLDSNVNIVTTAAEKKIYTMSFTAIEAF